MRSLSYRTFLKPLAVLLAAFVLLAMAAGPAAAQSLMGGPDTGAARAPLGEAPKPAAMGIENVFVIVIDGMRYSEAFGDPAHLHIPHIWNDLRPLGTIYTNFRNLGYTLTTASHATITSGVSQFMPNTLRVAGDDTLRIQDDPSMFQYYRSQLGAPADKTWIVNGKGKLLEHVGICQNPRYRDSYAPMLAFERSVQDADVWIETRRIIDTHHPSLTLINLRDVDRFGHTGIWSQYVAAIEKADEIVYNLCFRILLDPHYAENTVIFVTSDHGRHSDGVATGFKDHGCSCDGCRHVAFLAIGRNIKKDAVVARPAQLADIAPTVAAMLGFEAEFHEGRVLRDMFENPPADASAAVMHPAVAAAGAAVHAAACRMDDNGSQIVYSRSTDGGATWPAAIRFSTAPATMSVALAADGDLAAAAWNRYRADGTCRIALRESTDGGATWSQIVEVPGEKAVQPDYFPDLCYREGLLNVVWPEKQEIRLAVLQNGAVIQTDSFFEHTAMRPRCAAGQQGTHVVYQRYVRDDATWDIAYCLHDGSGWHAPVQICFTPGESLRPDIAVDAGGIHVVWAESDGGVFKIMNANSPDGISWDGGRVVAAPPVGAWHPRVASAANGLLAVWEDYSSSEPAMRGALSPDGGATWAAPITITPGGPGKLFPALSVSPSNVMHLVWMQNVQPRSIMSSRQQL